MKRVETRGEDLSRFDSETIEFHKTIKSAFLNIAESDKDRFFTLDASASRDAVHQRILYAVGKAFPEVSGQLTHAND